MKQSYFSALPWRACLLVLLGLCLGFGMQWFQTAPPATFAKEKGGNTTGDTNGDGKIDLADAVHILSYLFSNGEEPGPCEPPPSPRYVFMVRHAEKALTGEDDPPITPEGEIRAQRLAAIFDDQDLDAIYASELLRTFQTVQPLATAKDMPIQRFNHFSELYLLAESLRALPPGAVAVLAGHSYSFNALFNRLGFMSPPAISGYEQFFLVCLPVDESVPPQMIELAYP